VVMANKEVKSECSGTKKAESDFCDMGKGANAGLCMNDSSTATRILEKHYSPMIVRKYQIFGWICWVGIICDCNLNDIDKVTYDLVGQAEELGFKDGTIQGSRNFAGFLTDGVVNHYNAIKRGSCEGVAVVLSWDKIFVSSLFGDFMTHYPCKMELYQIINTMPHV
jgi:hypothetical protein